MSNINYLKVCAIFCAGIICFCIFNNVSLASAKGMILLSEDFQSSEIEKHFAKKWLNSSDKKINDVYISNYDYDYLNNLVSDVEFNDYQSYLICNLNNTIRIYLFSCDGSLAYSQSSYGDYCKFIYDKNIGTVVYRCITFSNNSFIDNGEKVITSGSSNEEFCYWETDFSSWNLISTSLSVYDCVELVDGWTQDTFPYFFSWDCLTKCTNLNRYKNIVADDTPVETINNHMYMLSCDVGFCGNVVQGDFTGFSSAYVYIDYALDKYTKSHIDDYLLHINYYLYVDGRKYEYLYVTGLDTSEYFMQSLSDIKFTSDLWVGNSIIVQARNGTFLTYQKQNLFLVDTDKKICELVVSCYLTGTTPSMSSGQFIKRFNLLNGQSTITDFSITENNNPYDIDSDGATISGTGNGVASIINNPSFSPVFNNNNNITIEGDTIDNDINNVIENDTSTKKDNESFIEKFLGFFNLLDNNSFLNVFTKVFSWLPSGPFTVLTSAIGIIGGIAVIHFFRK